MGHWKRPQECQLLIEDPLASRKHLICRTTEEGILVENLSTNNPVEVNAEELKNSKASAKWRYVENRKRTYRFHINGEKWLKRRFRYRRRAWFRYDF